MTKVKSRIWSDGVQKSAFWEAWMSTWAAKCGECSSQVSTWSSHTTRGWLKAHWETYHG